MKSNDIENSFNKKNVVDYSNKKDVLNYLTEKETLDILNFNSFNKDEKFHDLILEKTIIEKEKLYLKEIIKYDDLYKRENKLKKR